MVKEVSFYRRGVSYVSFQGRYRTDINSSFKSTENGKFDDEDFMFQLTKDEAENLSRCKNFTLNMKTKRGSNI